MSVPLRKDDFVEENLTTADLAQGKRPSTSDDRTALEDRLNDDRIPEDRALLEDRTIPDRTTDRTINDRPRPVLAERPSNEISRSNTTEIRGPSESRTNSDAAPLFPSNELEELRNRWSGVQTAFVDEPRRAVEQADGLVASAMKRLAEVFAEERSKLEQQWDRGDNVSTEDLRIALQRYRSFFHRLLAI
jgi:hypothetical protein